MHAYTILGKDQIPESIRNKPGWMQCVILAAALLFITFSAVGIGIPIGYTYCYIEYKAGFRMYTSNASFEILHFPITNSNRTWNNKTINEALMSSLLVSKILKLSRSIFNEEVSFMPTSNGKPFVEI